MLNSKFSRSLKGNEVKIDHSIYNHLEKEIHPKNIFAMDFFQCPTFENSFNNVNFFLNSMLGKYRTKFYIVPLYTNLL